MFVVQLKWKLVANIIHYIRGRFETYIIEYRIQYRTIWYGNVTLRMMDQDSREDEVVLTWHFPLACTRKGLYTENFQNMVLHMLCVNMQTWCNGWHIVWRTSNGSFLLFFQVTGGGGGGGGGRFQPIQLKTLLNSLFMGYKTTDNKWAQSKCTYVMG